MTLSMQVVTLCSHSWAGRTVKLTWRSAKVACQRSAAAARPCPNPVSGPDGKHSHLRIQPETASAKRTYPAYWDIGGTELGQHRPSPGRAGRRTQDDGQAQRRQGAAARAGSTGHGHSGRGSRSRGTGPGPATGGQGGTRPPKGHRGPLSHGLSRTGQPQGNRPRRPRHPTRHHPRRDRARDRVPAGERGGPAADGGLPCHQTQPARQHDRTNTEQTTAPAGAIAPRCSCQPHNTRSDPQYGCA